MRGRNITLGNSCSTNHQGSALNEDCRSFKGSEDGSRSENSPLCRGIELDYLVTHKEPLWLVFLKVG